jgi:predicted nucleic acid-binding protein
MTLVFDTSALSRLLKNDDRVVRAANASLYDSKLIPLATDAEVRFGFAYGSKQNENLKNYELFKQQFQLELVVPEESTAVVYADLATWCRKNGISLSGNDLWIAATCVQSGGQLLTLDKDFTRLPQVSLVAF